MRGENVANDNSIKNQQDFKKYEVAVNHLIKNGYTLSDNKGMYCKGLERARIYKVTDRIQGKPYNGYFITYWLRALMPQPMRLVG